MANKICRVTGTTHIFFLFCVMPNYLKVANFAFRWVPSHLKKNDITGTTHNYLFGLIVT
jgi:hypothetical protein